MCSHYPKMRTIGLPRIVTFIIHELILHRKSIAIVGLTPDRHSEGRCDSRRAARHEAAHAHVTPGRLRNSIRMTGVSLARAPWNASRTVQLQRPLNFKFKTLQGSFP